MTLAAPATAADRRWSIPGFDRLRVEAPVEVRVTTGGGASARASSDDAALLARLELRVDGGMLVVRLPGSAMRPVPGPLGIVTLTTPRLAAVTVFGAAPVTVAGLRGDRVDLTVNGPGAIRATGIATTKLTATLIGDGAIALSGRAADARLTANGKGTTDASALTVDQLKVQATEGATTQAAARYDAHIIAARGATVSIAGKPRCTVRATKDAPVTCGGR